MGRVRGLLIVALLASACTNTAIADTRHLTVPATEAPPRLPEPESVDVTTTTAARFIEQRPAGQIASEVISSVMDAIGSGTPVGALIDDNAYSFYETIMDLAKSGTDQDLDTASFLLAYSAGLMRAQTPTDELIGADRDDALLFSFRHGLDHLRDTAALLSGEWRFWQRSTIVPETPTEFGLVLRRHDTEWKLDTSRAFAGEGTRFKAEIARSLGLDAAVPNSEIIDAYFVRNAVPDGRRLPPVPLPNGVWATYAASVWDPFVAALESEDWETADSLLYSRLTSLAPSLAEFGGPIDFALAPPNEALIAALLRIEAGGAATSTTSADALRVAFTEGVLRLPYPVPAAELDWRMEQAGSTLHGFVDGTPAAQIGRDDGWVVQGWLDAVPLREFSAISPNINRLEQVLAAAEAISRTDLDLSIFDHP